MFRKDDQRKAVCVVCGYIYIPENGLPDQGVAPGTFIEELEENYKCPLCGTNKDQLLKV